MTAKHIVRWPFLTLIMAITCLVALQEIAMSASDEDESMSMLLAKARRVETISSDIAVKLAEMVFRRNFGDEVTDAQLPLVVHDQSDRWEVEGSSSIPSSPNLDDPIGGRIKIVIMKTDCRIVELVRVMVSAE